MRKSFWNLRIPTLLATIIIIIGIIVTSNFAKNSTILQIGASPSNVPENIRVTNISDLSFTVSYTTSSKVAGSISFGETKNMEKIKLDDRDEKTKSLGSYQMHYFTVNNLKPKTKYYFSITSGEDTFLNNNLPFEINTAVPIKDSFLGDTNIKGNIQLSNQSLTNEIVVYVTSKNSQILSTLVKNDNSYLISLNYMRTKNLNSYYSFSKDSLINMLIVDPINKSQVAFLFENSQNVPPITLGNNYDFTIQSSPLSLEKSINVSSEEASLKFPILSSKPYTTNKEAQILQPKENAKLTDEKPLFKGTAKPGEKIEIIINSEQQIKTQVTADQNGNWSYLLDKPLSAGEHKITIITRNALGILKTITKSFTVYAAGTQVNESATPSATPTVKITSTPTPTQILLPTITPAPTFIPTPTPTLFIMPTATPTIISITKPPQLEPGDPSLANAVFKTFATFVNNMLSFIIH